ncbi:MAG: hypothetical protein Q8O89_07780 [Nanoarchaeota archaeon]|nr:hypothetical protein [Nanoarchaeota archaeon]
MKKNLVTAMLLISLMIIFSSAIADAAPAPWSVAINPETMQCAGHWPGDEYVSYKLPSGWKAYFPDDKDMITTEFGSCSFRKSAGDGPEEEKKCCNVLGLAFVPEDELNESASYPFLTFLVLGFCFMIVFLAIVSAIVLFTIRKKLKKKKAKNANSKKKNSRHKQKRKRK